MTSTTSPLSITLEQDDGFRPNLIWEETHYTSIVLLVPHRAYVYLEFSLADANERTIWPIHGRRGHRNRVTVGPDDFYPWSAEGATLVSSTGRRLLEPLFGVNGRGRLEAATDAAEEAEEERQITADAHTHAGARRLLKGGYSSGGYSSSGSSSGRRSGSSSQTGMRRSPSSSATTSYTIGSTVYSGTHFGGYYYGEVRTHAARALHAHAACANARPREPAVRAS